MLDGEQDIVARAVRGESSAFGLLYDHYQPKIYRFVFVKTSRREEAEDLTHQVFLQAWQHIDGYEEQGFPFSSWLYRIARNAVIDYYRTKKEAVSLEEVDPEFFAHIEKGFTQAEINLELRRVVHALRELKAEHQDVIVMRFIEELSLKEVAHTLGKSEGAVKLIQHRALRELKSMLQTS